MYAKHFVCMNSFTIVFYRLAYATYLLEQVKNSSGQINHIILYDVA